MLLTPSNIIITGASSGIGHALALAYARPGVTLGLLGRDEARLARTAQAVEIRGAKACVMIVDVTDKLSMAAAIAHFDASTPIDLAVAAAGISTGEQLDGEPEPSGAAIDVLAVNVVGTAYTILPVLAAMRARGKGQIAVLGSLAARPSLPFAPAYCASKAAIEAYGLGLRGAYARYGVAISVISPGYVETPMSARLLGPRPFLMSAERAARIIQKGLARNSARIAFPWPLAWACAAANLLPHGLQQVALRRLAFRVRAD